MCAGVAVRLGVARGAQAHQIRIRLLPGEGFGVGQVVRVVAAGHQAAALTAEPSGGAETLGAGMPDGCAGIGVDASAVGRFAGHEAMVVRRAS